MTTRCYDLLVWGLVLLNAALLAEDIHRGYWLAAAPHVLAIGVAVHFYWWKSR